MNILVEGWRNINHSYALVNQWQIFELIKSSNIYFQDISFPNENWNSQRNDSGLREEVKNIINNIPIRRDLLIEYLHLIQDEHKQIRK